MDIIELEKWKPSADDPRKLEYAGQRTAEDVFEQLRIRLDSQGYLPDGHFFMGGSPQRRLRKVLVRPVDLLPLLCYTSAGNKPENRNLPNRYNVERNL